MFPPLVYFLLLCVGNSSYFFARLLVFAPCPFTVICFIYTLYALYLATRNCFVGVAVRIVQPACADLISRHCESSSLSVLLLFFSLASNYWMLSSWHLGVSKSAKFLGITMHSDVVLEQPAFG